MKFILEISALTDRTISQQQSPQQPAELLTTTDSSAPNKTKAFTIAQIITARAYITLQHQETEFRFSLQKLY